MIESLYEKDLTEKSAALVRIVFCTFIHIRRTDIHTYMAWHVYRCERLLSWHLLRSSWRLPTPMCSSLDQLALQRKVLH